MNNSIAQNLSRQTCLLFGNGINRCYNSPSWDSLLQRIAGRHFVSINTIGSSALAFEQIMCSTLSISNHGKFDEFALQELRTLDQINAYELYREFTNLPVKTILTTNFDYSIERALLSDYKFDDGRHTKFKNETRVTKSRHTEIEIAKKTKRIYHIHGELGLPTTICLGHLHYAENLSSIVSTLMDSDTMEISEKAEDIIRAGLLNGSSSWVYYFFTHDVNIIGFSADPSDIDIWWLLVLRAHLIISERIRISNEINYFYLYKSEDRNLVQCLNSLHVNVRPLKISDDGEWKEAYLKIADLLKAEIK